MVNHTQHLEEPEDVRALFQRICRAERQIQVKVGAHTGDFPILAEEPDRITLGISHEECGLWELKARSRVLLCLEDRGRKFEAVTEFESQGSLQGTECCHFAIPRLLTCLDEWRFAEFTPDRPHACTYTARGVDIRDGWIRSLGNDGVQMSSRAPGASRNELLGLKALTVIDCALERDIKVLLPCTVDHHGDDYMALRFREEADPETLRIFRAWLSDQIWAQKERDKKEFAPEGVRGKRKEESPAGRPGTQARLMLERHPLLLVIAEGDAFPNRIAESLGRKFGLATLDYVQGLVKPTLAPLGSGDWGPVKLILVHQRLRLSSGLELTHQLVETEACPLPILVAGAEEDVNLKRNRAIAAGAVDFISVDPFHVLRVMKAIEDTLKMFA